MRSLIALALLLTATITYAQDNIILRNGEELPAKVLEVNQTDLKYRKSTNLDGPVYSAPLRDVLMIKYANGTKDSFGTGRSLLLAKLAAPEASATDAPMTSLEKLRYHRSLFNRYYTGDNGQRIGMSEAHSLLYSQPDAARAFDQGRSLRTWSLVTAVPAVVLIGAGAGMGLRSLIGDGNVRGRNGMAVANDNDGPNGRFNRGDHGAMLGVAVAGTGVLFGVASLWLDHRASVQFRRAANRYNSRATTSLRFAPSSQSAGLGAVLTF